MNADPSKHVSCSTDPPVDPNIANEIKQTFRHLALVGSVGTTALETRDYLATFGDVADTKKNIDAAPFMRYDSYDNFIWDFRMFCLQRWHLQTHQSQRIRQSC